MSSFECEQSANFAFIAGGNIFNLFDGLCAFLGPDACFLGYLLSLLTKRNSQAALDRFYVKMKTPVDPDPKSDEHEMEKSYADPHRFDHRRLFAGGNLEFQKPTAADAIGFATCVATCFLIIWLAVWVAGLGG